MTGTGVQHYQHFVLFAGFDAFTKSRKENAVILLVTIRILFAQLCVREIFINMYRRFSPVRGAPRHIDTRSEGIVRQQFIEVVAIDRFQDGFAARRSIGGTGVSLIDLQLLLLRQQGVGVALIAIELEVGFSGRLANDKHYYRLLLVRNLAVSQFYLLGLLVHVKTGHTNAVGNIGPGL